MYGSGGESESDDRSLQEKISEKLGGLYSGAEDKYYDLVEGIEEKTKIPLMDKLVAPIESRGIPSFPVFSLLFLAALLALFLLFLAPAFSGMQATTLQVRTYSEEGVALSGVLVESLSEGVEISETVDAVAVFKNLPKKEVVLRFSKEGFDSKTESVDLTVSSKVSVTLSRSQEKLILRITGGGQPLSGAKAVYSFGSKRRVAESNASGVLQILFDRGSVASVAVSHPGFYSFSADYSSGGEHSVELSKMDLPGSSFSSFSGRKGSLTVYVFDEETSSIIDGAMVSLSDSNGAPLGSEITVGGQAVFEGIPFGTKAGISVSAEGYSSASKNAEVGYNEQIIVYLGRGGGRTKVFVMDQQSSPVSANISVFKIEGERTILVRSDFASSLSLDLENGDYYAAAFADGYNPEQSAAFTEEAGEVKIVLFPQGESASLLVKTFDPFGSPLNASVALFEGTEEDAFAVAAEFEKVEGGVLFKGLKRGSAVDARAFFEQLYGHSVAVLSNESNSISLNLSAGEGKLTLSAVNKSNQDEVPALFIASVNGTSIASCSSEPLKPCTLALPMGISLTLSAESAGFAKASVAGSLDSEDDYFVFELESESNQSNETYSQIELEGVFDSLGKKAESLLAGGYYNASFSLKFANADSGGFFVRLESLEAGAILVGAMDVDGAEYNAGSEFNSPKGSCQGSQKNEALFIDVLFKSDFPGENSLKVQVPFRVSNSFSAKTFSIHYRAYAVSEEEWRRDPYDSDFGLGWQSKDKNHCFAESKKESFSVSGSACGKKGQPCCSGGKCDANLSCEMNVCAEKFVLPISSGYEYVLDYGGIVSGGTRWALYDFRGSSPAKASKIAIPVKCSFGKCSGSQRLFVDSEFNSGKSEYASFAQNGHCPDRSFNPLPATSGFYFDSAKEEVGYDGPSSSAKGTVKIACASSQDIYSIPVEVFESASEGNGAQGGSGS